MTPAYVFRVRFRLDADVPVEPREFETVVRYPATDPGEEGWLTFQQWLWRGEVNDEPHLRDEVESMLGVPVVSVSFSEFETDESALADLREAIAEDLGRFNADSTREVLHKYFGSSIRVVEGEDT